MDKQHLSLNLPIVFSIRTAFLTDRYHFVRKMASKKKTILEQKVQAMKALDSHCSCTDAALKFGCGKSQISRIESKKSNIYC